MGQQVEISSINYSGSQANIIFTPTGSDKSYGLGIQNIPYIFNTNSVSELESVNGKYSIQIIDTNCSFVLVI